MRSWKGGCVLLVTATLSLGMPASPAAAATEVYPGGGSGFDGDAEGWEVTSASCNVPALCSASGGYDDSDGRPAGSVKAETSVSLNLVSLWRTARPRSPAQLHRPPRRPEQRQALNLDLRDDRR